MDLHGVAQQNHKTKRVATTCFLTPEYNFSAAKGDNQINQPSWVELFIARHSKTGVLEVCLNLI